MFSALFTTAIILGLTSSFHCIGMCGPLLLSQPAGSAHQHTWIGLVIYHSARIMTYGLLGVLVGFAGWRLQVAGIQQFFSLTLGIVLISYVFIRSFFSNAAWLISLNNLIFSFFGFAAKQKGYSGTILLGAANGLLPCGMVYIALAGAAASASVSAGAGFMLLFGLGTLPLLFAFNFFGIRLRTSVKQRIKFVTPFVIALMGVLLLLRGLNLGIPFISPHYVNSRAGVECH